MKIFTVVGTRPEIIRLSRTIPELDATAEHILVHTGQNHDPALSDIFFEEFGLRRPDHHLGVKAATAAEAIAAIIARVDATLETERPDAFLCLGDTNSCLSVIPAKRRKIPIFHVEAGNRCYDPNVPEEINRKIVDHTSDVNIAYSEAARRNLLAEGLDPQRCLVLGSPLYEVLAHAAELIANSAILGELNLAPGAYFVASLHRAETVDEPARLAELLSGLSALAAAHAYPVLISTHPRTRERLGMVERDLDMRNLRFCAPFGFADYIALQKNAACVLSDSGSLSEEAALLSVPAVALRDTHERLEAMDRAVTILAGVRADTILRAVQTAMRHHKEGATPTHVSDYHAPAFSKTLARTVLSHTPYVNANVWRKAG
ncbi:MAG: UDP-N-acetylglucosamine 2-epimerase (non-hydrolyzing) [Pseudomonadota bacterium]